MSFAGEIRQALLKHQPLISAETLFDELDIVDGERKKLYHALNDFVKRGEIVAEGDGIYRYNQSYKKQSPNKKQIMWRLLRARRRVSVEDLQELAGVSDKYAREWLGYLTELEIARKMDHAPGTPAVWQLINDTVVEPETSQNAEKLRLMRANRKAAKQLDLARSSLVAVRMSVEIALKELDDARRECEEGKS